jgi:hypothetical protein
MVTVIFVGIISVVCKELNLADNYRIFTNSE